MALTITQRPDEYSAAYLPIQYTLTSDLSPNTIANEISASSTLRGDSFSGEDVLVNTSVTPIAIVQGDYVFIENSGAYDGVHRVSSIVSGSPGVAVSEFTIDTPVTTESVTVPLFGQLLALGVTVSKYYNNYSAVLDVYIQNSFIVRLRRKRDINNEFVFDLSSVIQEYLGSDLLSLGTSTTLTAVDLAKEVYAQYAEEYDTISNAIATLTLQDFVDDSANTFNAVNSTVPYVFMRDFEISSDNYNLNDYYSLDLVSPNKFLTQQPDIKIGRNDSYQLSFINRTELLNGSFPVGWLGAINLDLVVRTYDSSNNIIATTATNIANDFYNNLYGTYNVPVGPSNLGATITGSTVKYEVFIRLDGNALTETKTFLLDDECTRIERRFEWVNKLGGVDAFTFRGKESRDIDVEKQTFKRVLNYPRVMPERSVTTFSVQSKDIYNVNSGIVSFIQKEWLIDLIESPEVYLVVDSYRLPVQVNDTFAFEMLMERSYNVTVEYELAFDKIIQRN